jgi:hypothetical protein
MNKDGRLKVSNEMKKLERESGREREIDRERVKKERKSEREREKKISR